MKTYTATVNVTLKKSVLDPQGKTVLRALESLGFKEAQDLRVGKSFVLTLQSPNEQEAQKKVNEMCEKLFVNPVIEEHQILKLEPSGASA